MKFVNAAAMVRKAHEGRYAVPAFNTNGGNYDIARAALEAAQETGSPLVLQAYEPNLEYRGMAFMVRLAEALCDDLDVTAPVALHIDHGHSRESALRAFKAGFTSYMIDASHEPLAENIRVTRDVLNIARALGCSVEAEVGYVAGNEKTAAPAAGRIPVPERPAGPSARTIPEEAERFVKETEVDMLAVAVGTRHGVFQCQDEIDFGLLRTLRERLDVPLVQHGTGGVSTDDLRRLAAGGMAKVNFGEPFRYDYIRRFNALTDEMAHLWHPWRIEREVKNRLKADMKALIEALGSAGKA